MGKKDCTLKKTKKDIFEVIEFMNIPINAEQIYALLEPRPNLSTVYRSLDYLEKNHIINSVSFDGNMRYYYSCRNHCHFIYCSHCKKVEVFDYCNAHEIEKKVESQTNFEIKDHVFYFIGVCENCRGGVN